MNSETQGESLQTRHDNLLTDCERSMRYHQERARFYDKWHRLIQFAVFAIAGFGASNPIIGLFAAQHVTWLMLCISLLALFVLVYNPVEKARLHTTLYRQFSELAGEVSAGTNPDEAILGAWDRRLHALYADEPAVYRALHAHCENQLAIALGSCKRSKLSWYHRLLRNFVPFQGTEFDWRKDACT